jgi:hypothetical protein
MNFPIGSLLDFIELSAPPSKNNFFSALDTQFRKDMSRMNLNGAYGEVQLTRNFFGCLRLGD